jgi:hypothetical protein
VSLELVGRDDVSGLSCFAFSKVYLRHRSSLNVNKCELVVTVSGRQCVSLELVVSDDAGSNDDGLACDRWYVWSLCVALLLPLLLLALRDCCAGHCLKGRLELGDSSMIVSYFVAFLLFWAPLCLVVGAKKYFVGALYKTGDGFVTVTSDDLED